MLMQGIQAIRSANPGITSIAFLFCLTILSGCRCTKSACDPGIVKRQVYCRTGHPIESVPPCQQLIPARVVLADGLSEGEAVETALSNNSAFQATVALLGMAAGDAIQASLLANPQVLIYFPTSIKEGQYTLYAPIESFFLRPVRVKVANREYRTIGRQLVQNGLDLARDVRVAYVDFALAAEQARLAEEAIEIRRSILDLTTRRLQEGDISQLESIAARVDERNASAAADVRRQDVSIAEAQVASLIGLPFVEQPLLPSGLPRPKLETIDEAELIGRALACRPDYHAARWAVAAAAQRSRVSRWTFLRLDGVLDVRSSNGPTRTGGGLRFDLPIFNRNQGGIVRADWELNAALHTRDALRDQIVLDVRTAARQYQQASDNLVVLEREVAPALEASLAIAKRGFADGGTDYLLVLQTSSQYLDVQGRILDQTAALARAAAQLERSVGCRLDGATIDAEALLRETSPPEELVAPLVDPDTASETIQPVGD